MESKEGWNRSDKYLSDKTWSRNPKIPFFTITSTGFGTVAVGGYVPLYGTHADIVSKQISDFYKGYKNRQVYNRRV